MTKRVISDHYEYVWWMTQFVLEIYDNAIEKNKENIPCHNLLYNKLTVLKLPDVVCTVGYTLSF